MLPTRIRSSLESYVAAWNEHDASARTRLLDLACTGDVLFLTSGQRLQGRAQLDALMADFQSRRPGDRAVFTSAIDVQGHLFRFTGSVESAAGVRNGESFDAGECDEDGRIRVLLTFVGAAVP